MINLLKRNLLIYFRDRSTVFFSMLSVIITFGMYIFFLGDMYASNISASEHTRFLMDSWIMAGILGVTSITTTLGAYGNMVVDEARSIELLKESKNNVKAAIVMAKCDLTLELAQARLKAHKGRIQDAISI